MEENKFSAGGKNAKDELRLLNPQDAKTESAKFEHQSLFMYL